MFVSERGGPLTARAVRHMVLRAGRVAGLAFPIHPHMLRHVCGFYLANKSIDTRAIQHYLGHCNIQHTVRYTRLTPPSIHRLLGRLTRALRLWVSGRDGRADFEVLVQVVGLLVLEQRLSYQALKRLFDLDDAYLEDIKVELIDVRQLARDHAGRMLVWTGEGLGTAGWGRAWGGTALPVLDRPAIAPRWPGARGRSKEPSRALPFVRAAVHLARSVRTAVPTIQTILPWLGARLASRRAGR